MPADLKPARCVYPKARARAGYFTPAHVIVHGRAAEVLDNARCMSLQAAWHEAESKREFKLALLRALLWALAACIAGQVSTHFLHL